MWGGLLLVSSAVFLMLRYFEYSQVYHPDRTLSATGAELAGPSRVFLSPPATGLN